jgi:hypothetical protein
MALQAWVALIALAGTPAVLAQENNRLHFRTSAVECQRGPELTGRLSDPLWLLAPPITLAYEIDPAENTPPAEPTTVKILYDHQQIYFGFDCHDSHPERIRAQIADRDRIFDDDFVIVFLDTYAHGQRAYELAVNPYGIQADLLNMAGPEDENFDAVWHSAASLNDSGWTAELAIPFKSLSFPARPEQEWMLMLGRVYPRESRHIYSWTPYDRNFPSLIAQAGMLTGLRGIESTRSLDFLPYVIGTQSGELNDQEDPSSGFANQDIHGKLGGGVRYTPTPDISLEGVVNPDFSQVEADAGQVSVNTTFALFYPEKRPFFLVGGDAFQTRITAFYSRMINNPLAAAKVSARTGDLSLSYLAAADRNTPFIVPEEEKSEFIESDLRSLSNILRTRYDFGKQSFLGAIFTARNLPGARNFVGGIDWNYLFFENWSFGGQYLHSATREVNDPSLLDDTTRLGRGGPSAAFDGESFAGDALQLTLSREAREHSTSISYRDFSPTFQAQNGFVTSNNLRMVIVNHSYTFYPEHSFADRLGLFVEGGLHYNYDGVRKERWLVLGTSGTLKGQTNFTLGRLVVNEERFHEVSFNNIGRWFFQFNVRPMGFLSAYGNLEAGRFIDREDVPDLGTGFTLQIELLLKLIPRLQLTLSYQHARLSALETDHLFYDGGIPRISASYQFTSRLFFRLIGEVNSFEGSVQVYPLLSYKLNPFTIFYAGATSSYTRFGSPVGLRRTEQQYFIKFQYLVRT